MIKTLSIALFLMLFCCMSLGVLVPRKNKEEYIAGIIYTEALGQSDYAKGLVATTIWIRAGKDPDKLHEICAIPKQYAKAQKDNNKEWEKSLWWSKRLHNGTFTPLSIKRPDGRWVHPDHFLQAKLLYSENCPYWARGKWHKKVDDLCFLMLGQFRVTTD